MIALLPFTNDTDKKCGCTPEDLDVILTSSAVAYATPGNPTVAEVCIVRLLVDNYITADVNRDLYINSTDVLLVRNSPYYNLNPSTTIASKCPNKICGPMDVNRDGYVSELDVISIRQSAFLGSHVPCGGVYATDFSCGSTRQAPLVPAVKISLDGVVYFSDDGLLSQGMELMHDYRRSARGPGRRRRGGSMESFVDQILVEFDSLHSQVAALKSEVENGMDGVETRLNEHFTAMLDGRLERLAHTVRINGGAIASQGAKALMGVAICVGSVVVACLAVAFVALKRKSANHH